MMLRARPTRGISLIEIVALMAVIGTLLTMSVTVLARAGQVYSQTVETAADLESSRSLAARLRSDAGRAVSAATTEDGTITFNLTDERRVRYALRRQTDIVREMLVNDQLSGRDRWHFIIPVQLESSVDALSADDRDRPSLARVRIVRVGESPQISDSVSLRVVARLGSLRLEEPVAASDAPPNQETGQ